MEKQFFIHGKPSDGESTSQNIFDGLEEQIFNEFFNSLTKPSESPCLVCEIRQWKGINYSIYSYYNDGRDYSNRTNGYSVLTLIVKEHYSYKIADIYRLMGRIYNEGLKRNLQCIDESGKFLISSFAVIRSWEKLAKEVYEILEKRTIFKKIEEKKFPISGIDDPACINPLDVDSEAFNEVFHHDGKIYVSTKFKSLSQKLNDLETKKENKPQSENEPIYSENERLKTENERLKTENERLKTENEQFLNTENKGQKSTSGSDTSKRTELEKWLKRICYFIGRIRTSRNALTIVALINSFLLCMCLIGIFTNVEPKVSTNVPSANAEEKVDTKEEAISQIRNDLNIVKEVGILQIFVDQNIDLVGKNTLQVGDSCQLGFSDSHFIEKLDSNQGEWCVDGNGTIKKNILKATKDGEMTISYKYKGITVLKRKIRIEAK